MIIEIFKNSIYNTITPVKTKTWRYLFKLILDKKSGNYESVMGEHRILWQKQSELQHKPSRVGKKEFPIVKDTTPDITILRLYITPKQERTFFERYVPVLIICIAYHHNTVSFR